MPIFIIKATVSCHWPKQGGADGQGDEKADTTGDESGHHQQGIDNQKTEDDKPMPADGLAA
jgi:hypothetical protein